MKLTIFAQSACDELSQLMMYLTQSVSALQKHNAQVKSAHPHLEGANTEYDAMVERLLAEQALCKTADLYQWYNREVLRAAALKSPSVLTGFPNKKVAAKASDDPSVDGLIRERELKDWAVREHLHKHLGMWEEAEMALIVSSRNCLVHAMGWDTDGSVTKAIAKTRSAWGVALRVTDGRLHVTIRAAEMAIQATLAQISIMDQQFARRYEVQASEYQPRAITRVMI